jgi:hypothetical protein
MEEVNNYNKYSVYKITSQYTDKICIGSTTTSLKKRLCAHMYKYKKRMGAGAFCISRNELLPYNMNIELIGEFFGTKSELKNYKKDLIESHMALDIDAFFYTLLFLSSMPPRAYRSLPP